MKKISFRIIIGVLLLQPLLALAYPTIRETGTVFWQEGKTNDGYTLIVPSGGAAADEKQAPILLVTMSGDIAHQWLLREGLRPTSARLLPNSTLFVVARKNGLDPGIAGSVIQELSWDGTVTWEVEVENWHHDVVRLPNGNIIGFQYEAMPPEFARQVRGGLPGTEDKGQIIQDILVEIDRSTKKPIWTWKPHEHLNVANFPLGPLQTRKEWTHANSMSYLPEGNPLTTGEGLLVSFRQNDLVFALEKASGSVRWTFGPGETSKQHDATLLDTGEVMIFDNGMHRPATVRYGVPSSRVITVDPESKEITWEYLGNAFNASNFHSSLWGGAQRLPNGNTLITEGITGRVFEIDMSEDTGTTNRDKTDPRIVWEYISPYVSTLPLGRTLAKAIRYASTDIAWPDGFEERTKRKATMDGAAASSPLGSNNYLIVSIILNVSLVGILITQRRKSA